MFRQRARRDTGVALLTLSVLALGVISPMAIAAPPESFTTPESTAAPYVALGDSLSSGEGADLDAFDASTDPAVERCHRASTAYPRVLAGFGNGAVAQPVMEACSGATIAEVSGTPRPNFPSAPQINSLGPATELVTISIGVNDVGFESVMMSCVLDESLPLVRPCHETHASVEAKIAGMFDDLKDLYSEIRTRAPNASVFVVGYPRIFCAGVGQAAVSVDEANWLLERTTQLNDVIDSAADAAGVEFVDLADNDPIDSFDAFAAHQLCDGVDSWVRGLQIDLVGHVPPLDPRPIGHRVQRSFHPTAPGHNKIAELLVAAGALLLPPKPDPIAVSPPPVPAVGGSFGDLVLAIGSEIVQAGQFVVFTGGGFLPGALVRLVVNSEPVDLDSIVADSAGTVSGTVTVPVGMERGPHLLVAEGAGPDGGTRHLSVLFIVAATLHCGATIMEDTLLGNDLQCPTNGLRIGTPGITLDLNGHTISGPRNDANTIGILNSGLDGVSIVNGTVSDFGSGISFSDGADDGSIGAMHALSNLAYGIVLTDSNRNFLDGNVLIGNGSPTPDPTSAGIGLIRSHENHLEENYAVNNADGILLVQSNRNFLQENAACDRGCDGNSKTGIALVDSDDNTLLLNEASENVRAGIFLDVNSTGNSLGDNVAVNNGGIGINVPAATNDLGGSQASENRGPVQCRNVACGPAPPPAP